MRQPTYEPWIEASTDAPRTDITDTAPLHRWAKIVRRYLYTSALTLIPLLLLTIYAIATLKTDLNNLTNTKTSTTPDNTTRAIATATTQKWLNTPPHPIPEGKILTWDGATPTGGNLHLHQFTLTDNQGLYYTATILLRHDPTLGPAPIGTPSLIPNPPPIPAPATTTPWTDTHPTTTPPSAEVAARTWAKAYLSDDPAGLRTIIGDKNPNHTYMPLTGSNFQTIRINHAAIPARLLDPDKKPPSQPTEIIINVTLTADRGQKTTTGQPLPVNYQLDLLIVEANSGAPRVVAWGGNGSGPTLTPYHNATTGREIRIEKPTPTRKPNE